MTDVKLSTKLAAIVSGGSAASTSLMPAAKAVTVHSVLIGSSEVGVNVAVAVPLPATVKVTGAPQL